MSFNQLPADGPGPSSGMTGRAGKYSSHGLFKSDCERKVSTVDPVLSCSVLGVTTRGSPRINRLPGYTQVKLGSENIRNAFSVNHFIYTYLYVFTTFNALVSSSLIPEIKREGVWISSTVIKAILTE